MNVFDRLRSLLFQRPEWLLAIFCACLVAGNVTRLHEWGADGFRVYLTQAIMQTTLFDFAWILAILAVFLDDDAKKIGVRWAWILPTFPFMPTLGVLLYLVARKRALRAAATSSSAAPGLAPSSSPPSSSSSPS